jgi:hypothetical protein
MKPIVCAGTLALGVALFLWSCLVPSPEAPGSGLAAPTSSPPAAEPAAPSAYYDASWADCSGADGKGGVVLSMGPNRKLALRADGLPPAYEKAAISNAKEWPVYQGTDRQALALEWKWVTQPENKFWGAMWAGSGLAMNQSWTSIDVSAARYLVMYVKASEPEQTGDLLVKLNVSSDAGGKKSTGSVLLSSYAEGGKLKTDWTRVVIPLASFPEIDRVDLTSMNTIGFDVTGKFPENQLVSLRLDHVYFTDAEMITSVENLGWVAHGTDVTVAWDKRPGEAIQAFQLSVDDKPIQRIDAAARKAQLSLAPGSHRVAVVAIGAHEASPLASVSVDTSEHPALGASVVVFANREHAVPPYFNGANFLSTEELREAGFSSSRWGGNATSKYNHERDLSSSAADWFFLNQHAKPEGTPEEKKSYYQFVRGALDAGAEVNFTIPMLPWIAKAAPKEGDRLCSYPASLYPKQQKIGSEGCGNGLLPDGKTPLRGNDPSLAMIPNSPEFQRRHVEKIERFFPGRVKFYTLDNEPGLWHETHRDVVTHGYKLDDLVATSVKYAAVIKAAAPSAKIIGLASWGMMELAKSSFDYESGDSDRTAHGDAPNVVSFLRGMKQASDACGQRLLDVLDAHWYPEVYYVKGGQKLRLSGDLEFDPVVAEKQFAALREFYDPKFDLEAEGLESWAANADNRKVLWDAFHPVIPTLKRMIDEAWPGTKLAINEYASGSASHYHGALLRTALLGIFMQEDLYMAEVWDQPRKGTFAFLAHQLFGNYDGKGNRVRGAFVPTTTSHADVLSYAARDGARTYVVLVNKNQTRPIDTTIELPRAARKLQTFTLAKSLGQRLLASDVASIAGRTASVRLPAFSAQLSVVE